MGTHQQTIRWRIQISGLSMIDSLEDYARVLGQRHIVDLVYVASAVILLYDLILTLHLEVSLVWYSRWNYTKVLYLLTRYVPFAANGLILYSHLIPGGSVAICANTFQAAGWLYLVGLDLAEVILAIRTWACWGRNKWVGIGLAVWTLLCQVPSVIFMYKFLASLRFGSPIPRTGLNSCFVTNSNRLLWGNWAVFLSGEGVTLILMGIFAYRTSREGNNTPLVKLMYRDGLIFYIYLFCMTSMNIALTLALDSPFVALVSPAQSAIHSVLTTRIILNIREVASQRLGNFSVDLHMSDTDSHACRSPIAFAANRIVFHSGSDQENLSAFRHGEGYNSGSNTTRGEMVSTSTHSAVSHVTLPMTRDARGKKVVGREEPDDDGDDDDDDDKDSIRTSPEDWV